MHYWLICSGFLSQTHLEIQTAGEQRKCFCYVTLLGLMSKCLLQVITSIG